MNDIPSLENFASLKDLLSSMPSGESAARLASTMGIWTPKVHKSVADRSAAPSYPSSFSGLSDAQLSDTNAYWLSELARSIELVGMLEGQLVMVKLKCRSARAASRVSARESFTENKVKATAQQVDDVAEASEGVLSADGLLVVLETVLASAKAYKEACSVVSSGVSREISFRQALLSAKVRM